MANIISSVFGLRAFDVSCKVWCPGLEAEVLGGRAGKGLTDPAGRRYLGRAAWVRRGVPPERSLGAV